MVKGKWILKEIWGGGGGGVEGGGGGVPMSHVDYKKW